MQRGMPKMVIIFVITTLISFTITLSHIITAFTHSNSTLKVVSSKLYIVKTGSPSKICFYIEYSSNNPAKFNFVVYMLDALSNSIDKVYLNNVLLKYPGRYICLNYTFTRSSLYYVYVKIYSPETGIYDTSRICRIISVKEPSKDVIMDNRIVVVQINRPIGFSLKDVYKYAVYSLNFYENHSLDTAKPCFLGKRLVILIMRLPVSEAGVTYIRYAYTSEGIVRSCIDFIAISNSIQSIPFLKHTIAHELFHAIQANYIRNVLFLKNYNHNLWTIEGGAEAATYFVWGKQDIVWIQWEVECWFLGCNQLPISLGLGPRYMYDPSIIWYLSYKICIDRGNNPQYCRAIAYSQSYMYSPLVLYIFTKLGFNVRTINMLYGNSNPNNLYKMLNSIIDAYVNYSVGFAFSRNIKPKYIEQSNGEFNVSVWSRAAKYILLLLPEGYYKFRYLCTDVCHVDIFLISDHEKVVNLRNSSIVYLNGRSILIIVGDVPTKIINSPVYISYLYSIDISFSKVRHLECDFDNNGKLDLNDVKIGLEVLAGIRNSNTLCDLNHNGRFDIGDLVLLLTKISSSNSSQ